MKLLTTKQVAGTVGNFGSPGSPSLYTGTHSRNCQGGENMAASTGRKEAP